MNRQLKKAVIAAIVGAGVLTPAQGRSALWVPKAPAIIKPAEFWKPHEKKLLIGMPITMGMFKGGRPAPICTYRTSSFDDSNTTSLTFSGLAIGTAAADRLVVVCCTIGDSSTNDFSAFDIGGSAGTLVAKNIVGNGVAGIYQRLIAAGTTTTVDITVANSPLNTGVHIFTITGLLSTTPADNNNANGADPSVSLNVPTASVVIACACSMANTTCTWIGPTERSDNVREGTHTHTSASIDNLPANAAYVVTADFVTNTTPHLAAGAWA